MFDYLNVTLVAATAGLGIGWWLRGQSVATIQADITSIKQEIINLKNLFTPAPVVPVVAVAPVA